MYGTFLMLIWCSYIQTGLMQTTSWDLVTSPPIVFGKQVKLRCTILNGLAPCCTSLTRTWIKGSSQIMSNGVTNSPSKYSETLDAANNQFSLIISNLDKDDVDVIYTCDYGSTAVPNTLAQNDSFEYHPTGLCPVTLDNGKLVGTLSVAMSAPRPSVTAQYGGTNFTSYWTTNIAPVTSSPKFYTINSYIMAKATCGNGEKFTLSVLTGVTTTNICNNEDLCQCAACGNTCLGFAVLGTIYSSIVFLIVLFAVFPTVWMRKPHYFLRTGKTVILEVSVISIPPVTNVYWQRNGANIHTAGINRYDDGTPTEPSFKILGIAEADAGRYTCFATNFVGTGKSSPTDVHVKSDPDDTDRTRPPSPSGHNEHNRKDDEKLRIGKAKAEGQKSVIPPLNDSSSKGQAVLTTKQKLQAVGVSFVVSIVADIIIALLLGNLLCHCFEGTVYYCILIGVGTCYIAVAIVLSIMIDDKCKRIILLLAIIAVCHLLFPFVLFFCCKKCKKQDDPDGTRPPSPSGHRSKSYNDRTYELVPQDSLDNHNKKNTK